MPGFATPTKTGVKHFQFVQSTESTTWYIHHGFGATPLVDIKINLNGQLQKADPLSIVSVDANNLTINWTRAQSGVASLAATIVP
jgi:hypothetical protein